MKNKRVIINLMIFLLLIVTVGAVVFAWLVDYDNTDSITLKSGKVEYQLTGSAASGLVVPGQNLLENPYKITNQSTVDSQLRVTFLVTITDLSNTVVYNGDLSDPRVAITVDLGTDFVKESDNFYYYGGTTGVLPQNNTTQFTVISSIFLNGEYIHNDYSGYKVKIDITIQAKQLGYDWQTLITEGINFQTGN